MAASSASVRAMMSSRLGREARPRPAVPGARGAEAVLAQDHPRGPRDPVFQPPAALQLLDDHVVVLGLADRLGGDGFAHVGIEGQAEDRDALQALFLEGREELGADEDQPFDQRRAREVHLRRLEGAVQIVHDVDELQQQILVPSLEPALEVAGGAVAERLVVGLELPVGSQHFLQAVFGEAGALRGRIGRGGFGRFQELGEPSGGILG
jgi:hypothetical protein